MKTIKTILMLLVLTNAAIAQTWSSVGSGIDSTVYPSANYLYVNPIDTTLLIGTTKSSGSMDLYKWNNSALSIFSPSFGPTAGTSFHAGIAYYSVDNSMYCRISPSSLGAVRKIDLGTMLPSNATFSNVIPQQEFFGKLYCLPYSYTGIIGSGNPMVYNGTTLSILHPSAGTYSSPSYCHQIKKFDNALYVCGKMLHSSESDPIIMMYSTDGTTWNTHLNTGLTPTDMALCMTVVGSDVYFGGQYGLRRWNNSTSSWDVLTTGAGIVDLCTFNGKVYGITNTNVVFEYPGTGSSLVVIGTSNGALKNIEPMGYSLYVTGAFTSIDGNIFSRVARWTPSISTMSVSLFTENLTCYGSSNGSAHASVSGGILPYTYTWKDAIGSVIGTDTSVSGLSAGNYTVEIHDADSVQIISFSITQPSILATSMFSTPGSASVLASGGTSPYSYLWSTSDTNDSISGLPMGMVYVTVTDSNGCTAYDSTEVDGSTGLSEHSSKAFVVYPNPSSSSFNFVLDEESKVFVYDNLGRLVKESMEVGQISLELENAGVYTLVVVGGSKNVSTKIVKQ